LQFHPGGGATFTGSVRLRIVYADRAERLPSGIQAPDRFHASLLNAQQVATWAAAPRARESASPRASTRRSTMPPAAGPKRQSALPEERLRVRIGATGIYELSQSDLRSVLGTSRIDGIDPRTFKLYFDSWQSVPLFADSVPASWQSSWDMQEAAIWVPGESDGSFDATDRIVFYALGPEGYAELAGTSTDSLRYDRHPYDRNAYAWLVWDGDFGRRMVEVPAAPDTTSPTTRVWHREHRERDVGFDAVEDLWYWQEIRHQRSGRDNFPLDLGGEASTTGTLRLTLSYPEGAGQHDVEVRLNNIVLGHARFFFGGAEPHRYVFNGVTLRGDAENSLVLTADPVLDTARATYLLDFDLTWDRRLMARANGTLEWSARPSPVQRPRREAVPLRAGEGVYEIGGFGSTPPYVFDVTEPLQPQSLTGLTAGTAAGSWKLAHARGGARVHFLAALAPADVQTRDLLLRHVAPLRARTTAPDMLIVTHESLLPAAERLAAHRRGHFPGGGNPDILVTSAQDIYDNFSGGRLDPLAIRNYAKFLYRLDATPRLAYLCLFGDGNHDYRRDIPGSPLALVPPIEPAIFDLGFVRQSDAYVVDDWFAEMETPQNGGRVPFAVPDLGLGRLCARNLAEADRIVDKIVAYETASGYGPWRARILMAADDEVKLNFPPETFHVSNTEDLCRRVPRDLDVIKFYETEYPMSLGQKPQARAAFIRTWSEGCSVLNFQGHGAARQLTDEVLFLSTDIPSLTNGPRLPLFLPISCTVSEFDDPERQSMCEDLVASPPGGAIATIGATTPTYVSPNFSFNLELFEQLFANGSTSRIPLGVIFALSKAGAPVFNGTFNETYVLIGDPALALLLPQAQVRFTSGADSLFTGNRARLSGQVVAAGDTARIAGFEGQAEVEVRGTADTSGYRTPPPDNVLMPYNLPGPPFYRATVPVHDGRFSFQFIAPVGARAGNLGIANAYAASATLDARGEKEDVVVQVVTTTDSSLGPPRIALRLPNNRTHIKAGTPLTAEIRDENGINIQGTSTRNSILLDFDRHNEPLNVTSQFRYAEASDSVGTVTVPLPGDLEPGPHQATLIASDNLQNTSSATVEFEVVSSEVVQLVNVLAFPNPFKDWTRFFFEITDPADVEVQVFTTSGRQVWRQKQRFETPTQGSMKWDGVDHAEDTLANGTYIYRLRAQPDRAGTPALEFTGKVVIMR
jgi:hypothetical protein